MLLELTEKESPKMLPTSPFGADLGDVTNNRVANIQALISSSYLMEKLHKAVQEEKTNKFNAKNFDPIINFSPVANTKFLKLIVSDINPERTRFIAESLVKIYLQEKENGNSTANLRALGIIEKRTIQGEQLGKEIENHIREYHKLNPASSFVASSEQKGSITSTKSASLVRVISQYEIEIIESEEKLQALKNILKKKDSSTMTFSELRIPEIDRSAKELLDLDIALVKLRQDYKDEHPKVMAIKSSQRLMKNNIEDTFENIIAELGEKIKSKKESIQKLRTEMYSLTGKESKLITLANELEINKEVNIQLLKRKKELELSISAGDEEFVVIEHAKVPEDYFEPRRLRNIMISIVAAIIVAFVIIIVLDFINPHVLSSNDFEKVVRVPVLKTIPAMKKDPSIMHNNEFMFFKDRNSFGSEIFRHLRSKVEHRMKKGTKTLLVTSPNADDGKTCISINLALALSLTNKKVLLIDADLRKASFNKVFVGLNPKERGLSDVLTSDLEYSQVVVQTLMNGLDIMFAGKKVAHPAELLAKDKFIEKVIKKAEERYDYIIIDSTKANMLIDPLVIAKAVENVLFVSSFGTTMADTYQTITAFRDIHCNIIGGVLNKNHEYGLVKNSYYYYGADSV